MKRDYLLLPVLLLAIAVFAASTGVQPVPPGTEYGDAEKMGDGEIRTFVNYDENGLPTALGIEFDDAALEGLPDASEHYAHERRLNLPAKMPVAPYDHMSVDWVPMGHEPPGVYDIPHLDIHFYMMSDAQRDAILPTDPEFQAKSERTPDAQFMPAGYILPPGFPAVPRMGSHMINPAAPELNGELFTHTLIWGAYDGEVTFLEPMITRDFLIALRNKEKPYVRAKIAQPMAYKKDGYYPSHYNISYDASEGLYRVTLEGLKAWD